MFETALEPQPGVENVITLLAMFFFSLKFTGRLILNIAMEQIKLFVSH